MRAQEDRTEDAESLGVSRKLACHIRTAHGMDVATYRREVLRRSLAEWPVDIPAQVLRTRLHAYKTALNDASFAVAHCALCARQKRVCKLTDVEFPPPDHPVPPAWLGVTANEWLVMRADWYKKVDELLDIEAYLNQHIKAQKRVGEAEAELEKVQGKHATATAEVCGGEGCTTLRGRPP